MFRELHVIEYYWDSTFKDSWNELAWYWAYFAMVVKDLEINIRYMLVYLLQVKIIFRLNFDNLGWFAISFVS